MERRLGRMGAGALGLTVAFAAGAEIAPVFTAEAKSKITVDSPVDFTPLRTREISCKQKQDFWVPGGLKAGDRIVLKANGAVVPADEILDGQIQYDNDADTATTFGLRSSDGSVKTWVEDNNYDGSLFVLHCNATRKQFYEAVGREASRLDLTLGKNDPTKRVNYNYITK